MEDHGTTVDDQLARFDDICREHGVKATHQRLEIYRELVMTDEHPDAEMVYKRVQRRIPAISLDTVYRTLRLFAEKGVISRLGAHVERMRFDGNTDPHHHFVCAQCGLICDVHSEKLDAFPPPAEVSEIGNVDSVHVEMRGVCEKCMRTSRE